MTRNVAVWAVVVFTSCGSWTSHAQTPAPAGKSDDMTSSEATKLAAWRELAAAGKHDDLLSETRMADMSKGSYAYKREVLMLQAESYRRVNQAAAALGSLTTLQGYAVKQPEYRRKKDLDAFTFLIRVYRQVRNGRYISPTADPKTTTAPGAQGPLVSEDSAWESAKQDCARYALACLDPKLRDAEKAFSTDAAMSLMTECLESVAPIRPHFPEMANEKAVAVVATCVKRCREILDTDKYIELGQRLVNLTLWPRDRLMPMTDRRKGAEEIRDNLRRLCLAAYRWGQRVTLYGREYGIESQLGGSISSLTSTLETLKSSFVDVATYVDKVYTMHGAGEPPFEPLKQLPSERW